MTSRVRRTATAGSSYVRARAASLLFLLAMALVCAGCLALALWLGLIVTGAAVAVVALGLLDRSA